MYTHNTNKETLIIVGSSQSMNFTDVASVWVNYTGYLQDLYKLMTAHNIYRFSNENSNKHSIEVLWARRHSPLCSRDLGCLPHRRMELCLRALVWVVEWEGKPLSGELVPWSSIENPVLLNQDFKVISQYSERPFLFRQQWKIIWIDPDP